ncbi:4'-phosphopantetheinyl transferase superfamily protein [Vibrio sp. DW001]|uniref:4'-phosphopantetheinyl transferase family protein n=1 Tax=Vibrio sp. DW001 TaxID=2912315 RepID=UPI0023AE9145|nr:4'-phosphopantetheinyl transferase superfamily protein [Vibrio sp. DW001]WED28074.1 4'-phosphopantetheinyl transferase superfamily protein [Vibrio sp. DW001]
MSATPLIQLWFFSLTQLDDGDSLTENMKCWLSEDEQNKVARYRQHESRTKALYVRCLLRAVLSQYAPIAPDKWQFKYGKNGKPTLITNQRTHTGIEFNLSHSGDYLLIGVVIANNGTLQLGVDIEHARPSTNIDPILNHYFSAQEASDLLTLPQNQQRQRFFDLWVLKESYIKATGQGLAKSLKSFGFDLTMTQKEWLLIQTTKSESSLGQEEQYREVEFYRGITPYFIENKESLLASQPNNQPNWQSCLGRLNEQYRFAVTLGNGTKPMKLNATLIDPSQLLLSTDSH